MKDLMKDRNLNHVHHFGYYKKILQNQLHFFETLCLNHHLNYRRLKIHLFELLNWLM